MKIGENDFQYSPSRKMKYADEENPIIDELIKRISGLESKLLSQSQPQFNGNNESEERKDNITDSNRKKKIDVADLESKINFVLSDLSDLSEQISGTVINVRDVQRQNVQNNIQLSSVSTVLADVQRDVDSRRG